MLAPAPRPASIAHRLAFALGRAIGYWWNYRPPPPPPRQPDSDKSKVFRPVDVGPNWKGKPGMPDNWQGRLGKVIGGSAGHEP